MADYRTIKKALIGAGIQTYAPGEKNGICTAPYAVIREAGTYPFAVHKNGYTLWVVHLYVPLSKYRELAPLQERVKTVLKGFSELKETGNVSPDIIEEKYQAHTRSMEYQLLRTFTK